MAEFANVESVEAIARFRVALIQFEEETTGALDQLERQAQKFLHWLESDSASYWRLEVLRCHEKISRARSALDTAMMRKTNDFRPACIEEKDNLRLAKDRLYQAEVKTEKVRRWARLVREEVEEYRGRLNRLRDCLGVQVPRGLAVLDRTLRALEKYTELAPPPADVSANGHSPGEESISWNESASPPVTPVEPVPPGDSRAEDVTGTPPLPAGQGSPSDREAGSENASHTRATEPMSKQTPVTDATGSEREPGQEGGQ
ncbi:MAG TPA: hypothetical protein DDY91_11290 [Planctomycetaceae bacterium]|nr:hypothetical protein [Planctomycetaceae bacterium]